MSDFEVCPVGTLQRLAQVEAQRDALRAEVERITVNGIHSCHAECQRPVCRLTRERDALRRDAERYRWLRTRACHGPHERFVSEYGWFDVSGQHEPGFDAAIDAAMKGGGNG